MKLLFIIDDLLPGGTENALLDRLHYRSHDTEVRVVTLFGEGEVAESMRKIGIEVDFLDIKSNGYLAAFKSLRRLVKENRPDIAVCMRGARMFFPRILQFWGLKVVMYWGNPILKHATIPHFLERCQISLSRASYLCCSNSIKDALRSEYSLGEIEVISNCINPERFKKSPEHADNEVCRLISVGNLRSEKNHFDKLLIASALLEKGVSFHLDIVGEGPLRPELESKIKELKLSEHVSLLGRRKDVPDLLYDADIFLFTSSSEGFPLSVIEATASALPCVVYKLPVLLQIDPKASCMIVVPQKDIVSATEQLVELIENPEERRRLGNAARQLTFKHFTADIGMREWEEYLRKEIDK